MQRHRLFALTTCMCLGACGLALFDYAWAGHPPLAREYAAVGAIGLICGALSGLGWGALFAIFARLSPIATGVAWAGVGFGLAGWLALSLGVFTRLGSEESELALWALAGCGVSGVALSVLGLVHQPAPHLPGGLVANGRGALRASWVVMLCLGCAATVLVDRNVEAEAYPSAHLALRWLGLWLLGFAGLPLCSERLAGGGLDARRMGWVAAGSLALTLGGVLGMGSEQTVTLHRVLERPYPALFLNTLREMADLDRDGYAGVLGGGDCEPLNPIVNPGAHEVPNNGIDDNCQLGDLTLLPEDAELPPVPPEPAPLNVVLITVDTLRADHLGVYGYERRTSPRLDAWARHALRFERAYTTGGWTTLALTSMFRGLYPRKLQWTRLWETTRYRLLRTPAEPKLRKGEELKKVFMMPLDDPHPSLPALLQRRGMHTATVVDDSYTHVLDAEVGGFRNFDDYVEIEMPGPRRSNDAQTTKKAFRLLARLKKAQPFFLWIHYFGPHAPSEAHPGVTEFGDGQRDRYDHEILNLDSHLGALLGRLDTMSENFPMAVLLSADHGETFSRRGRGHGHNLHEGGIRIPLLLKAPGIEPGVSPWPVSLIDVMPTVLGLTSTPAPPNLDGVDLRLRDESRRRVLLTDTWRIDDAGEFFLDMVGAFDGERKLVFDRLEQDSELSSQDDPHERDLSDAQRAPELRQAIDAYLEAHGALVIHD